MKKQIKASSLMLVGLFALLWDCGQSGSSSEEGMDEILSSAGDQNLGEDLIYANGRVIDAPLADALVFLDCNNNLQLDTEEASGKSDSQGRFKLTVTRDGTEEDLDGRVISLSLSQQENCKLVSIGGIDIETGKVMDNLKLVAETLGVSIKTASRYAKVQSKSVVVGVDKVFERKQKQKLKVV